jgi:hypothetical protein
LVRVASAADASFVKTAGQSLFYQHLALDVVLWLLDHWTSASSLYVSLKDNVIFFFALHTNITAAVS